MSSERLRLPANVVLPALRCADTSSRPRAGTRPSTRHCGSSGRAISSSSVPASGCGFERSCSARTRSAAAALIRSCCACRPTWIAKKARGFLGAWRVRSLGHCGRLRPCARRLVRLCDACPDERLGNVGPDANLAGCVDEVRNGEVLCDRNADRWPDTFDRGVQRKHGVGVRRARTDAFNLVHEDAHGGAAHATPRQCSSSVAKMTARPPRSSTRCASRSAAARRRYNCVALRPPVST